MNEVIFIHVMDKITKGGVCISKLMYTYGCKLDGWKLLCDRKTALRTCCGWRESSYSRCLSVSELGMKRGGGERGRLEPTKTMIRVQI